MNTQELINAWGRKRYGSGEYRIESNIYYGYYDECELVIDVERDGQRVARLENVKLHELLIEILEAAP